MSNAISKDILRSEKFSPEDIPYLVCVPDGEIKEKESQSIVEVKCPFKCRDQPFESFVNNDAYFCLEQRPDGTLTLKKDHNYHYQVQGMLNMMKVEHCYFAVWSPQQFHWEIVTRDERFWNMEMLPVLQQFYRYFIVI